MREVEGEPGQRAATLILHSVTLEPTSVRLEHCVGQYGHERQVLSQTVKPFQPPTVTQSESLHIVL